MTQRIGYFLLDNYTDSGQYEYEYTYDNVGNRTSMAVTDNSGTRMHLYTYDNIYQVTEVNYPVGYDYLATDTTFHYDGVGNRTTVIDDGGTTTYTTNPLNQYTSVGGEQYVYDLSGNLTYDGANMYGYDPENRLTTVEKASSLLSVGCDIVWMDFTTGGDAVWFYQTDEYHDDGDAVQSGDIDDDEEVWMETTVEGTGIVRFWWKVYSEVGQGDEVTFYIDGVWKGGRSGNMDWYHKSNEITTPGTHTLRWRYDKGSSGTSGDDCAWVDCVTWSGTTPDPNGWQTIEYTYDALRPEGREGGRWDDGAEVRSMTATRSSAEYDVNDTLLRKYIYGPGIDQPICMIESSGGLRGHRVLLPL